MAGSRLEELYTTLDAMGHSRAFAIFYRQEWMSLFGNRLCMRISRKNREEFIAERIPGLWNVTRRLQGDKVTERVRKASDWFMTMTTRLDQSEQAAANPGSKRIIPVKLLHPTLSRNSLFQGHFEFRCGLNKLASECAMQMRQLPGELRRAVVEYT